MHIILNFTVQSFLTDYSILTGTSKSKAFFQLPTYIPTPNLSASVGLIKAAGIAAKPKEY